MGRHRCDTCRRARTERGFTLVELMIVIAIIGLVASFALPALRDARLRANETAAIGMLRALHTAQGNYKRQGLPSTQNLRGYAHYLLELTEAGLRPGPLRPDGSNRYFGLHAGYRFYTHSGHATGPEYWQRMIVIGRPVQHGKSGQKSYLMTEEGQIYYRDYAGWLLNPAWGKMLGGG